MKKHKFKNKSIKRIIETAKKQYKKMAKENQGISILDRSPSDRYLKY